jgi:hypothetical protein
MLYLPGIRPMIHSNPKQNKNAITQFIIASPSPSINSSCNDTSQLRAVPKKKSFLLIIIIEKNIFVD